MPKVSGFSAPSPLRSSWLFTSNKRYSLLLISFLSFFLSFFGFCLGFSSEAPAEWFCCWFLVYCLPPPYSTWQSKFELHLLSFLFFSFFFPLFSSFFPRCSITAGVRYLLTLALGYVGLRFVVFCLTFVSWLLIRR